MQFSYFPILIKIFKDQRKKKGKEKGKEKQTSISGSKYPHKI